MSLIRWKSALLAMALTACSSAGQEESRASSDASNGTSPNISIEAVPEDSVLVEQRLAWAREQRLDTLPIGAMIASFGRTFVGAPYIPGSLEVEGPERLVVNLRSFDCVTFVESMLALARTVRSGGHYPEFTRELLRIRYRDGKLAGYPSRLHYFSEWIANNDAK